MYLEVMILRIAFVSRANSLGYFTCFCVLSYEKIGTLTLFNELRDHYVIYGDYRKCHLQI